MLKNYNWRLALSIAAALAVMPVAASAQDWPSRTVRIVVPNGPGGGTDIVSRILADSLSKSLGASFVVENKPGAGTTIGAASVAKAEPDGYTMLMMSNAHAVSGAGHPNLKYEPIKDFSMVSLVGTVSLALITSPDFPPKSSSPNCPSSKESSTISTSLSSPTIPTETGMLTARRPKVSLEWTWSNYAILRPAAD